MSLCLFVCACLNHLTLSPETLTTCHLPLTTSGFWSCFAAPKKASLLDWGGSKLGAPSTVRAARIFSGAWIAQTHGATLQLIDPASPKRLVERNYSLGGLGATFL